MTVQDAIEAIRQVGTIRAESGKLKLQFPEAERGRLEPAFEILRQNRDAALAVIAGETTTPAQERATPSGNPEAARKEVWISYHEWKARELNRLFDECEIPRPERKPAKITAETVRDGIEHEAQGKGKR